MTQKQHTPTPWHWELSHKRTGWEKQYTKEENKRMEKSEWENGNISLRDSIGNDILRSWGGDGDDGIYISKQNAEFIVRAVNSHAELVEALKLGADALHPSDSQGDCLCSQCDFVRAKRKALAKAVKDRQV